ncbi:GntR family transcriptional regulator [Sinirhodobacter populi]|uniref:GntR family transcriptional regulator n=1 Tax=Paenirhodobacter populi TaxID=2306993 RepID=A0A443KPQ5_9RHOB|nr:GntR family transcriptional regulator [Sinirhodobacter populi]RWR34913.1 GntR family transcriptional regulator [Sinirhodobacter populi]
MEQNTVESVGPTPATLGHQVYEGLRSRILRHELRMGDPLREDEVASWFCASRLPAREAMRRLEHEGLVARAGRKYVVRRYSGAEILVTYRLRAALEHLAVELSAERMTPADEDRIAGMLERQKEAALAKERGEFSLLDLAFHMSFAEISRNAALCHELGLVMNRVTLIRGHELDRDSGPLAAYDDHCRIFGAVCRRDLPTACAELDYHYATTLRLHHVGSGKRLSPLPSRALRHPQDESR